MPGSDATKALDRGCSRRDDADSTHLLGRDRPRLLGQLHAVVELKDALLEVRRRMRLCAQMASLVIDEAKKEEEG